MFKFIVLFALIACAAADSDDVHAEATVQKSDVRADGFESALETSNHIHQVASGDEHGNIHGEYEWLSPEGKKISVQYVADENGVHATGDVIPTPPPVPEAILKALEYIKAHPVKEESHH